MNDIHPFTPLSKEELEEANRAFALLDVIMEAEGVSVGRALQHLAMTLGIVNYNSKTLLKELEKFRENSAKFFEPEFRKREYNSYLQRIYTLIYNYVSSVQTLVYVMYRMKKSARIGDVKSLDKIGDAYKKDRMTKALVQIRNLMVHGDYIPVSCRWFHEDGQGKQRVIISLNKKQKKGIHKSLLSETIPKKKFGLVLDELVSNHVRLSNTLAVSMRKHVIKEKSDKLEEVNKARKEYAVVTKHMRERDNMRFKTIKP